MCGILGVRRDRVGRATALQALRRLAWRGADDLRLIAVGSWWLGVARLVISDPQAPQPITDQATGVAMKHLKSAGAVVEGKDVGVAVKQMRG